MAAESDLLGVMVIAAWAVHSETAKGMKYSASRYLAYLMRNPHVRSNRNWYAGKLCSSLRAATRNAKFYVTNCKLRNLCISPQRMCLHMRAGCGSIPAYAAI